MSRSQVFIRAALHLCVRFGDLVADERLKIVLIAVLRITTTRALRLAAALLLLVAALGPSRAHAQSRANDAATLASPP
ncbi:MAG: hypothetical protein BRD52_02315, partial [Bacteroidetes bacterium SW_4_67_19]